MMLRRGWFPMLGYNTLLILSCLSCTDPSLVGPGAKLPLEQPAPVVHLAGSIECTATVRTGEITCTLEETRPPAGISAAVLGKNQVLMASSNVHYDTLSAIFSFDATVKNLLATPIGTLDGTTKTGIKVVYHEGPTPTSYYAPGDTGTITVMNASGRVNFTRKDQPYHFYDTILLPNQTSAPLNWKLNVPRTVETFGFTILVYAAIPGEPQVPDIPPDTTPAWVYEDSNMAHNSPHMSGSFPRNVFWVRFHPGTTQEEKQAAIDYVGGLVVGGVQEINWYAVRVQDDGTTNPLFEALGKMEMLPQVRYVGPGGSIRGGHLLPTDDPNGWGKGAWNLNPDSATEAKWGLERISAPLAWGCETGNPSLRIAVIDFGFHAVSDLRKNSPDSSMFGRMPSKIHGTQVASVLAARGNDSTGMTGVMWRAHLDLYDPFGLDKNGEEYLTFANLNKAIVRAGRSANIINLSSGLKWEGKRTGNAQDSALVKRAHEVVRDALIELESEHQRRPLIIIAAMNDTTDAYWSGVANVAADPKLANRVIVVGASTSSDSLAAFSNRNESRNLVSVLAPGEGVGTLDNISTIRRDNGTSFAAPYVTGLAGLLQSFDSRLTAEDLKKLIVDGANNSGRKAGGIPIINAYESLKLAAQNPGAPLCGSRVWTTGGKVLAQRKAGPEKLFDIPAPGQYINVKHGGRHIRLSIDGRGSTAFALQNGSWREIPDTIYSILSGGMFLSSQGVSHDLDKQVTVWQYQPSENQYRYDVSLYDAPTNSTAIKSVYRTITSEEKSYCTQRNGVLNDNDEIIGYNCAHEEEYTIYSDKSEIPKVAYSPAGDRILLAISRMVTRLDSLGSWETCPSSNFWVECRSLFYTDEPLGVEFHSIDLRTMQEARVANLDISNAYLFWMGLAEGGREFATGTWRERSHSVIEWEYFIGARNRLRQRGRGLEINRYGCSINYRDIRSNSNLYTIAPAEDCYWYDGVATMNSVNAPLPGLIRDQNDKAPPIRRD